MSRLGALLVAAPCLVAGPSTEQIELRLGGEPGDVFRFEDVITLEVLWPQAGPTFHEFERTIRMRVLERDDDGLRRYELVIEHIAGSLSDDSGTVLFDSEDGADSYRGQLGQSALELKTLAGHPITVTLGHDGRIRSLRGYVDVYEGTTIGTAMRNQGKTLTDESFIDHVQPLFPRLPDAAIDPTTTWTTAFEFEMFKTQIELTPDCRITDVTDATARWAMGPFEKVQSAAPEAEPDAVEATYARTRILGATIHGKTVFDRADGQVRSNELEAFFEVSLPASSGGDLRAKITQGHRVRRIDDED